MTYSETIHLLRYRPPGVNSWMERNQKAAALIADMSTHAGWDAFMDYLEGEVRSSLSSLLDPEATPEDLMTKRLHAMWARDLVEVLREKAGEKALSEELEANMKAMAADVDQERVHVEMQLSTAQAGMDQKEIYD